VVPTVAEGHAAYIFHFCPEDGCSMSLQNVGNYLPVKIFTALKNLPPPPHKKCMYIYLFNFAIFHLYTFPLLLDRSKQYVHKEKLT
jgi:hypothetical protein